MFLSTTPAAKRLGVTEKTLRVWTERGFVRHFLTPTGQRRYRPEDLDAFIASRTSGNPETGAA